MTTQPDSVYENSKITVTEELKKKFPDFAESIATAWNELMDKCIQQDQDLLLKVDLAVKISYKLSERLRNYCFWEKQTLCKTVTEAIEKELESIEKENGGPYTTRNVLEACMIGNIDDNKKLSSENDSKQFNIRLRNDLSNKIDQMLLDRPGMSKTVWILEAINEKLKG